ncbi:MAG: PAS domain-containing protein [Verrucomicrobiia bacterium]
MEKSFGAFLQGILFGAVAVIAMLRPMMYESGLFFDGRSIVLSLCGLFFGPYALLPAMAIAILCRAFIGGIGMITGILSILVSSFAGIYYWRIKKERINSLTSDELFKFGFFTHLGVLLMMITIPGRSSFEIVLKMAIPFLIFYPLATMLAGKILLEHRQTLSLIENLNRLNDEQQRVFYSIYDAVIVADTQGRIVNMNPSAVNLVETSLDRAKGEKLENLININPEDNPFDLNEGLNLIFKEGKNIRFKELILIIKKNGKRYYADLEISPIKADKERIDGAVLVFHNRTQQKEAESQIQLLSKAIETAGFAVFIADKERRIEYVNPAFTSIFGYTLDDCIGKRPQELIRSGFHSQEYYEALEKTLAQGDVWSGEIINRKKDGTRVNNRATITPIKNQKNEIIKYVGIYEDLTKTKTLEEQLIQAQKMEIIGRLAGGVAHDFNNVLSVIKLSVDLLRGEKNIPEECALTLDVIEKSTENATNIAQRILAFSRVKSAELFVTDINDVIGGMSKMLQRLLGSDITVRIRGLPSKMMVEADRAALEQAIMNLAINARDAMPNGGTLEISADYIFIETPSNPEQRIGEFITITVKDSGTGIPPDILPNIFKPFFTTKAQGKGTGLGLSIVKDIVQKHNGWIEVESIPGTGTKFTIFLPRYGKLKEEAPKAVRVGDNLKGSERILLVEDDSTVRVLAAKILRAYGYNVIDASDGKTAIARFDEVHGSIDLLLTDIVLAGRINGYEVAKRLKEKKPDLKIVYMSGYPAELEKKIVELNEGVNFILKPLGELKMLQIIRRNLDIK